MKKRILSLILALLLVIGMIPVQANANELDNGLQYEVYADHVTITGYTGEATEIIIPAEIEGVPVTRIRSSAFYGCKNLTSIHLPDGVTIIGMDAFYGCSKLTSINLPDTVTEIESRAFGDCSSLTSISIPKGVTSIGYSVFSGCSDLASISIPDSVTEIGFSAFSSCFKLASIDLPDSVTTIGSNAFRNCISLTSIYIPDSVTEIGDSAFVDCSGLTEIHVDENNPKYSSDTYGVLFDKEKTEIIQLPCAISGSYTIPNGVTEISYHAFYGCSHLNTIFIPDSLTEMPDGVLGNCFDLIGIHVDENNPNYSSDDHGVLFNKEKTILIRTPRAITDSYSIPDGVTKIGDSAFYGCSDLTSITIPASVTEIGDSAFSSCSSLATIYFKGDAPLGDDVFRWSDATAYYPADNPTWTADVMQAYGEELIWVPYNPNNPFTDVPTGAFYEAPVLWALENNITTGASADSFNPDGQCLRAQVVTFLHRAAGNPAPGNANNPFTDVKTSDFFYAPVLWAVEKGITNGTGAATFGSYDVCNRAAVVTFLWRAAGSPEPKSTDHPFTDVKSSDFFYKPVLWAIENGITNGVDATHFGPTSPCNRAQVVTFLYRAYN